MIPNFDEWKKELIFTGRIVQDGDNSVSAEEAHRRFLRYVELVENLDGSEGTEVLASLFQSVQMQNDYGAYQTTYRIMGRFPDEQFIEVFINELPSLIERQPEWAGEFLVGLANGQDTKWDYQIEMFNNKVSSAPVEIRQPIVHYIRSEETAGWLDDREGVLCPRLN